MSDEDLPRLLAHRHDVLRIVKGLRCRAIRDPFYSDERRAHIHDRLSAWAEGLRDTTSLIGRALQ